MQEQQRITVFRRSVREIADCLNGYAHGTGHSTSTTACAVPFDLQGSQRRHENVLDGAYAKKRRSMQGVNRSHMRTAHRRCPWIYRSLKGCAADTSFFSFFAPHGYRPVEPNALGATPYLVSRMSTQLCCHRRTRKPGSSRSSFK